MPIGNWQHFHIGNILNGCSPHSCKCGILSPVKLSRTFLAAVWVVATSATACGDSLAQPALNPVTPLPAPEHPPVTLVSEGVPQFVLMWDSADARARDPSGEAYRSVREAVRTLRREIWFCTGKEVVVVDTGGTPASQLRARRPATPNEARAVIHVGAPGVDPSGLPPEGFVVTTCSNGVAIAGATLWGAYDFLERFFGCRYYYPPRHRRAHARNAARAYPSFKLARRRASCPHGAVPRGPLARTARVGPGAPGVDGPLVPPPSGWRFLLLPDEPHEELLRRDEP